MSIWLACPECRTEFTFPDELRGQTVRCKTCNTIFVVAAATAPPRKPPPPPQPAPENRIQDRPRPAPAPSRHGDRIAERENPRAHAAEPAARRNPLAVFLLLGGLGAALVAVIGIAVGAWLLLKPASSKDSANSNSSTHSYADANLQGGGPAVLPDAFENQPLRYQWKGGPHVYAVHVEVDKSDHLEIHQGNCVVHAGPGKSRRPREAGERKGNGTGFVLSSDGWLLTCEHVTARATKVEVTIGGKTYPARVVAQNRGSDLAVLRISEQNLPTLSIGDSESAQVGQDVWALGYPLSSVLGSNLKATRGTLSGLNVENGRRVLQIDASVNPGNSGGPLVSETGKILGVTNAGLVGRELSHINFAVPSSEVQRWLTSERVPFSTDGWTEKLDGPTLVRRVSAATALILVTKGAAADSDTIALSCQGQLQKSQIGKPGTNYIPPFPSFTPPGNSKVEFDESGRIQGSTGGIQMPCLLGDVLEFLIDPLPDDGRANWEVSSQCTITESSGGFQSRPFGPMGMPGMPGMPGRPPGFPGLGGMPGRPFGPPGLPGFPGGQETERETRVRIGEERTDYARLDMKGDLIRIRKNYEMKIPPAAGISSSLNLSGSSLISFDTKLGLPRTVDFSGTFNATVKNISIRMPLKVTYKLMDGQERDGALKPPQPPATPPAAGGGPVAQGRPGGAAPPPLRPGTQKIVGPAPPATPPEASVALASPPGNIVVGAGGHLLILHLPTQKHVAIFDVKQAKIVKTLPMADEKALLAAGQNHLVVFSPTANVWQRWNLTTFKREAAVPNSSGSEIKAIAMGSASNGPLVVYAPALNKPTLGLMLADPKTFKIASETIEPIQGQPAGFAYNPDLASLTCSADGRVIVIRGANEFTSLARRGGIYRGHNFHANTPLPTADGQSIIDHGQTFSVEGKAAGPKRGGYGAGVWCAPGQQGSLSMSFNQAHETEAPIPYIKLMLHAGTDSEPLVTFPRKIDALKDLIDWLWGKAKALERHVFLVPDIGALVVIPEKKDRIDVYRFDLDQLLKDAKRDYLLVVSQPITEASRGSAYVYRVVAKTGQGAAELKLESGPQGMSLAPDGTLNWSVPADFKDSEADVVVSVRNAAGTEIFHSFQIRVGPR